MEVRANATEAPANLMLFRVWNSRDYDHWRCFTGFIICQRLFSADDGKLIASFLVTLVACLPANDPIHKVLDDSSYPCSLGAR